jgi:hypothetical protein
MTLPPWAGRRTTSRRARRLICACLSHVAKNRLWTRIEHGHKGVSTEPKWDGHCGIGMLGAGQVQITSRHGSDMTLWFPELGEAAQALGWRGRWSTADVSGA